MRVFTPGFQAPSLNFADLLSETKADCGSPMMSPVMIPSPVFARLLIHLFSQGEGIKKERK